MDNITNAQTNTKTILKTVIMISAIVSVLSITLSSAYALPPHWGFNNNHNCTDDHSKTLDQKTCCWVENVEPGTGNPDIGGNQEKYCQTCYQVYQNGEYTWDCDAPELQFRIAPTTDNGLPIFDLTPTENEPIKPDGSISPNEDNNAIDETQSNTNTPLNDQRVPPGNVGVLEQLEDSSNSESDDSVSSDNPGLFNVVPQNPAS